MDHAVFSAVVASSVAGAHSASSWCSATSLWPPARAF